MNTLLLGHQSVSFWDSAKMNLRIAVIDFLTRILSVGSSINDRLLDSISSDLIKQTALFEERIRKAPELTSAQAVEKKENLLKSYPVLNRLDSLISRFEQRADLKDVFKRHKKTVYKYEAVLQKVASKNSEIIETPEYLKVGLSRMGMGSFGMK